MTIDLLLGWLKSSDSYLVLQIKKRLKWLDFNELRII